MPAAFTASHPPGQQRLFPLAPSIHTSLLQMGAIFVGLSIAQRTASQAPGREPSNALTALLGRDDNSMWSEVCRPWPHGLEQNRPLQEMWISVELEGLPVLAIPADDYHGTTAPPGGSQFVAADQTVGDRASICCPYGIHA